MLNLIRCPLTTKLCKSSYSAQFTIQVDSSSISAEVQATSDIGLRPRCCISRYVSTNFVRFRDYDPGNRARDIEHPASRCCPRFSFAGMDSRVRPEFVERILPVDDAVATRCAYLHSPDRRNEADALIAATALVHGLTLVTHDIQDFYDTGAIVIDPWQV